MSSNYLETLQIIYICIAAWVGLCVGSFLNVVVYRLPIMLKRRRQRLLAIATGTQIEAGPPFNLSVPRSRCPCCGHQICWFENVPVVSYLVLAGQCSSCKTRISMRYPLVEATTGLMFAYCIWQFGVTVSGLSACILGAGLLVLALMRFDNERIEN